MQTLAEVLQSCVYKITLRKTWIFCYYQVKCHQYWPEGEETLAFGSLEIICTKIRDFSPSYIYREMYVTDSKVSRKFVKKSSFSVNTAVFLRVRYRSNFVNADLTLCFISQSLRSRVVVQLQYIAWPDHGKLSRWCTRRCVTPLGACVVSIPGTWCLLH